MRRILLPVLLAAVAPACHAQRSSAARCAPIPASRGATITFGHRGGSLMPSETSVLADGRVSTTAPGSATRTTRVTAAQVTELARLARTGGFWTLRAPPITRPPIPDLARRYIEVRLTCGTHRAEYLGDEPPAFATLFSRLTALTGER